MRAPRSRTPCVSTRPSPSRLLPEEAAGDQEGGDPEAGDQEDTGVPAPFHYAVTVGAATRKYTCFSSCYNIIFF